MDTQLKDYLLRTVRIGVLVTVAVVALLVVLPWLPGTPVTDRTAHLVVVAFIATGALVIGRLPWPSLIDRGWGHHLLYLWSIGDILLVTALLVPTGGADSPLFWTYALTTVFFAASYPLSGQGTLVALTVTCYLAVGAVTDTMPAVADVAERLVLLGLIAWMCSFLSRELLDAAAGHAAARDRAERHAALLAQVADSARHVHDLDPERAKLAVLTALDQLGFHTAALVVRVDEDSCRVDAATGRTVDGEYDILPMAVGVVGEVFRTGRTIMLEDCPLDDPSVAPIREEGVVQFVAVPIQVNDAVVAVLLGGTAERGLVQQDQAGEFELLAGFAAQALENADRFRAEQEANERLAELDAMKTDFLATVSRELRTPLTVIAGAGRMLSTEWDAIDDRTRQELLVQSNASVDHLSRVIRTMLDLSAMQAGQLRPDIVAVDLGPLLATVLDGLDDDLARHQVVVSGTTDVVVMADRGLLARVLDDLLRNVAVYTPAGTLLAVTARPVDGEVEVEVLDRGPGIPPAVLDGLGTPFLRAGPINTRGRGLGLGLAMAKETLRLHDRELVIASTPGLGTRCRLTLPAAPTQPAPRTSRRSLTA